MREFAKVSEVKVGDMLEPDAGFTCLCAGDKHQVKENDRGELYIECASGRHHLGGQSENGVYIGLYRVEG